MSILIKMEMPLTCSECPMSNDYRECNLTAESFGEMDCVELRADWCPLIEVPKHGRLIDADAAMKAACEALCHLGVFCLDNLCKEVRETFDAVPTIIESEEEE